MSSRDEKKYYLLECEGYYYVVPSRDLMTVEQCCAVGETVKFKYGKQQYQGTTLFVAGKEKDVQKEIKRLKKEKKAMRESSFHADAPRKCTAKQREVMQTITKPPKSNSSGSGSSRMKAVVKRERDSKKAIADAVMEKEVSSNSNDPVKMQAPAKKMRSTEMAMDTHKSPSIDDMQEISDEDTQHTGDSSSSSIVSVLKKSNVANSKRDAFALAALGDSGGSCSDDLKPSILKPSPSNPTIVKESGTANVVREESVPISDEQPQNKEIKGESGGSETSLVDSEDESSHSSGKEKRKHRKKKSRKHRKSRKSRKHSKKSKKHRRRRSSSSSSSSSSTSTSSSDSSASELSDEQPKKRMKVRRNLEIYSGQNFLYNKDSPNVEKLHPNYEVYVKQTDVETAIKNSKTTMNFVRLMVDKIYTVEALQNSTAQGFPARGCGRKVMKKTKVLPRLHPDGRAALLERAEEIEKDNKV